MTTRRQFAASLPGLVAGPLALGACSTEPAADSYFTTAARTWQVGATTDLVGEPLARELVRSATLAPSSHNTQCWTFALDPATDAIRVSLEPTPARSSNLYTAIPDRQCTRGDYDGKPLSALSLSLLQRAGSSGTVRLLLLTDRPAMERTLDYVIQGNTAQLADPAFVAELKSWVRFNGAEAVRTHDGLYSATAGSPNIPSWIGRRAFRWLLTPKGENDRYARQVRSSAGIAVFVGLTADKANWVEVGRCYERFALQATALGIRNAFLNQPVEVAGLRLPFAETVGFAGERPDLVVRFGRGAAMPRSLRRGVEAVVA
ncbi:MAG: Tat pathway signal protein [Burkholderiales bacterium]|nr:Tat pathway signal protein [Burkholderiales bacterium]